MRKNLNQILSPGGRPRSLTELADLHGTDKGTRGPSEHYGCHNYTDIYEAYLSTLRTAPVRLLEIGVGVKGSRWDARIVHGRNSQGAASLRMWRDYFPNGQIWGADINPCEDLRGDRISTVQMDQGSSSDLTRLVELLHDDPPDIIVDDGSHRPDHQQLTLGLLFPLLKPGGMYFIEDLDDNGLGDGRNDRNSSNAVRNTRAVLGEFASIGAFGIPNALGDGSYLASNIEAIALHAPIPRLVPGALLTKAIGRRGMLVQYKHGTQRLCAIRKRSRPALSPSAS